MDFQLNEEQLHLKKTVREFAEREIAPNVMKWDEASEFPLATVKELGKLGLMGIIFPPEYGGAGMGYIEYATAVAELSRELNRFEEGEAVWIHWERNQSSTLHHVASTRRGGQPPEVGK